ncbi:MAG: ankyrin repeat domain-containing protein [Fimbriimonadaceae bacterium]|nr:MAG: ankyrin repeat domain-containing protein [Fimbriimonadaceae bacterium]
MVDKMNPKQLNSILLAVLIAVCLSCSPYQPELHKAAAKGDLAHVKSIIESGVDVNIGDENGNTALYSAVSASQWEVADYLLSKGGKLDYYDKSNFNPKYGIAKNGTEAMKAWIRKNYSKL